MSARPSGATVNDLRGPASSWARFGDGRLTSLCQFDVEDEDGAFAYAEERMRATPSRLAMTNRASLTWDSRSDRDERP